MAAGSLARRYAKAIVSIGTASNTTKGLGANLAALAAAMKESAELQSVLSNPAIRRADRRRVLDALLARIAQETRIDAATKVTVGNIVNLLLDGERLVEVPAISREVDAMIQAASGEVSAAVTSARKLSPAELSSITAALAKLSGKIVNVTEHEDRDLLGGVVAKVGDVVYDGSLRTQLRTLRDELTK